jgi:hypothetical protein
MYGRMSVMETAYLTKEERREYRVDVSIHSYINTVKLKTVNCYFPLLYRTAFQQILLWNRRQVLTRFLRNNELSPWALNYRQRRRTYQHGKLKRGCRRSPSLDHRTPPIYCIPKIS